MAIVFSNNARTTLASNISNSATTITVADGSVFPSLTGGDIFYCTIDDGTNNEIIEVTAISSNTLTVVRAQDNTTARSFVSGDLIELRLVARVLETFPQVETGELTADEFIGDLRGAVIFKAKAGEAVSKGDAVYVSGISGNTPVIALADADFASKMPAFGLVLTAASTNGSTEVVTFGTISGVDTSAFSVGDTLYISTTAGALTDSKPTGEGSLIQNIGKVQRSHASSGSIKVGGAGRTNDVPNLNDGNIFIGNASNQATTASLNTKIEDYLDANGTTFPDSVKAQFGSSNDLQIYHDGSHSYIQDSGSGNLRILVGDMQIRNYGTNENIITSTANAEVALYYNASEKLATSSTGINVAGTVTSDGLTVDGTSILDSETNFVANSTASNKSLVLASTGATGGTGQYGASLAFSRINTDSPRAAIAAVNTDSNYERMGLSFWTHPTNTVGNMVKRMQIDHDGDISFYEDTGTTAKFFWDASAESLGIGTTSPATTLTVEGSGANGIELNRNGADASQSARLFFDSSTSGYALMNVAGSLTFNSGSTAGASSGTERMRITSSGELLLNKTSASVGTDGVQLRPSSYSGFSATSNTALFVNRNTDDGDVVEIGKNGVKVGSIGTVSSGDLYIADGRNAGIKLDGGNNQVLPVTSTGSPLDATLDLGNSGVRFKDLYLSGTVTATGGNSTNWNTAYGWGNHASAGYLASSSYTAADVLTKIKTVDGSGSGLDADLLDGYHKERYHRSALSTFTSGDWNNLTTHGTVKIQHSNFNSDTNPPPASYAYGIAETLEAEVGGENRTLQIYYPHSNGDRAHYIRMFNSSSWTDWRTVPHTVSGAQTVWHSNNDGSGSGLDADLLDGQHGSYYLNYNNFTNTPTIPTNNNQLTNGAGYITSFDITTQTDPKYLRSDTSDEITGTLTVDSGTSMGIRIEHDSFGQALELHREDTSNSASIKFSNNSGTSGILFAIHSETDPFWRQGTGTVNHRIWHAGNDGTGSGLHADLLDGQHGSHYLDYNNFTNTPTIPSRYK